VTGARGDRPHVTLKLATSLDGRIAAASGESRWITGPEARRAVHELRASHDAVMVGIGTALADDPELNARTETPLQRQPMRVVIDSACRLRVDSKLAQSARVSPVIVYATANGDPDRRAALAALGVEVRVVDAAQGRVDLLSALRDLLSRGVKTLFVEGGSQLAASLINSGLVDRLEWMRAPMLLGADGAPSIGALADGRLVAAPRWRLVANRSVGEDSWESYEPGQ